MFKKLFGRKSDSDDRHRDNGDTNGALGNDRGDKRALSNSSLNDEENKRICRRHSNSESTFIIEPFRSFRKYVAADYSRMYGGPAPAASRPTPMGQGMSAGGEGGAYGAARAASVSNEGQGQGQDRNRYLDLSAPPSPISSTGSDSSFLSGTEESGYDSNDAGVPPALEAGAFTWGRGSVSTLSQGWSESSWTQIYDWASESV